MRTREPLLARETPIRPAVTREWYASGAYSYPAYNAADADQLPIVFLDGHLDGSVSWPERSEHPPCKAISPVGWLPPETRVEVAFDGRRWRICQAPNILHARSTGTITAAEWAEYGGYADACQQLNLGSGMVQLLTKTAAGVLSAQYYSSGSAVTMLVYNTADEVAVNKGLTLGRDRDNQWTVLVEPCLVECSEE